MLKPGVRNIAYGASDFEDIRQKNDYYVDKTRFIPVLEQNRYLFFIRPRRFGKSLWASIL
ncbi:MAG: AAA family ATPase, partial [SAR324 cluster bacterium]|nr:AAA family ATPase [SAR324 cluster bacterium]